jgi:hypothetical protein
VFEPKPIVSVFTGAVASCPPLSDDDSDTESRTLSSRKCLINISECFGEI